LRKLPQSRVRVALIYNVKEEAKQEQTEPVRSSLSLNPSIPPVNTVNPEVSPDGSITFPRTNDLYAEWDTMETINAIRDAIAEVHDVVMVEADRSAYQKLAENSPDFAFNVSEGLHGVSREAQIPGMLEMLQIPYLGSNPLTLATCLDKARTKEVLTYHRVPTPAFSVAHRREDVDDLRVRFPSIVKPLHEGSSKGIYNSCVVRSPEELIREVVTVLDTYHQPALIEEFLPGREFTVAVMGNGREAYCLPIVEINYDVFPVGVNPVYSYEAKWVWDTPGNPLEIFRCPAEIDQDLQSRVERIVLDSYRILGCRDWSRIDVRLDRNGIPNIIEVNPLPGVLPKVEDNSCFPKAARAVGLSYNALIQTVLNIALARTGILVPVAEKPAAVTA